MLGYLRFALAILVSLNHLWVIYGVGRLAVFSFYVISGYLMTAVIQETYGTTAAGIRRYATNRMLRIYPAYLIVFLVFSAVLTLFSHSELQQFSQTLAVPSTPANWLKNATLIGLDSSTMERIVPAAWTLLVELTYYALIPMLLVIGRRSLLVWLGIAVAYHLYMLAGASPADASIAWEARYGNIAAGSLGFAIGACTRNYLPAALRTKKAFVLCLAAFCGCYALSAYWSLSGMQPSVQRVLSTFGYYGTMVSVAPMVDYLARLPKNRLSEHFGDYSYPFYLLHIPVGFVIFHALGAGHKTVGTLLAGIAASLLASWAFVKVDKRISSVRSAIRQKNTLEFAPKLHPDGQESEPFRKATIPS